MWKKRNAATEGTAPPITNPRGRTTVHKCLRERSQSDLGVHLGTSKNLRGHIVPVGQYHRRLGVLSPGGHSGPNQPGTQLARSAHTHTPSLRVPNLLVQHTPTHRAPGYPTCSFSTHPHTEPPGTQLARSAHIHTLSLRVPNLLVQHTPTH